MNLTKIKSSKCITAVVILSTTMLMSNTVAFISRPIIRQHRNQIFFNKLHSSIIDGVSQQVPTISQLNIDNSIYSQAESALNYVSDVFMNNQEIVGTIFQYLSKFALDLSIYIVDSDDTPLLHLISVLGRLFAVLGDYLPDHFLRADELAFQISMLVATLVLLTKSVYPLIKVSSSAKPGLPDRRDVIAFRKLFEPVGLSWIQFKYLFVREALVWVEVKATDDREYSEEDNVDDLKSIDLLEEESKQSHINWIYNRESKSFDVPHNIGDLAYIQFAKQLESQNRYDFPNPIICTEEECPIDFTSHEFNPDEELMLLRVNTEKMIEVIEGDNDLFLSILFLVVNALQQKNTGQNNISHDNIKNLVPQDPSGQKESLL